MVCQPTSDDPHQALLSETSQTDVVAAVVEEYQAGTQSHGESHIATGYDNGEFVDFEVVENTSLYNYLESSMSQSVKLTPPFELQD